MCKSAHMYAGWHDFVLRSPDLDTDLRDQGIQQCVVRFQNQHCVTWSYRSPMDQLIGKSHYVSIFVTNNFQLRPNAKANTHAISTRDCGIRRVCTRAVKCGPIHLMAAMCELTRCQSVRSWLYLLIDSPHWPEVYRSDRQTLETGSLPSVENLELKGSLFKAWRRSAYTHACYAYCQGFLPCSRFIHLHFFQTLLLCWLWFTPVLVWVRRMQYERRAPCLSLQTIDAGSGVLLPQNIDKLQNVCYCFSGFAFCFVFVYKKRVKEMFVWSVFKEFLFLFLIMWNALQFV